MSNHDLLTELLDVYGDISGVLLALGNHAANSQSASPEAVRIYAERLTLAAEALEALIERLQRA